MAKVSIKSEKITPFGGIFHVREQFFRFVGPVIDKVLGLRCTSFGYQYSEIAGSLASVYFCGGDCVEDVTSHLHVRGTGDWQVQVSQTCPCGISITHTPSLSLPSRFRTPFFCKAERSRSMVRWLTDKVSDICLPVIVGDSLIRLSIFC